MEEYTYQNGSKSKEQEFQKLTQNIGTNIQKILQDVSSMEKMVKQIGTHQDSRDLHVHLHDIQHHTKQWVDETTICIQKLKSMLPSLSQLEQRQGKFQHERLHDEFTAAVNKFQILQRSLAQKERAEINRAKVQAYGEPHLASFKKDDQLIELQDSGTNRQQIQLQEEVDLRALEEQERAIHQLEGDINDVNQIFKKLGTMVHEQGEIVDNIETSVERSTEHVRTGTQQLLEASTYKNKIRKKKLILAGIGAIILLIIIIIIIWKTR